MDGKKFRLICYRQENGFAPMEGFLDSLEQKLQAKALRDLAVLQAKADLLREPMTKPLGKGLFELRLRQSNDIARMIFFFCPGRTIVVTHGFVKKSGKTPRKEIERALRYKADWERRHPRGRP